MRILNDTTYGDSCAARDLYNGTYTVTRQYTYAQLDITLECTDTIRIKLKSQSRTVAGWHRKLIYKSCAANYVKVVVVNRYRYNISSRNYVKTLYRRTAGTCVRFGIQKTKKNCTIFTRYDIRRDINHKTQDA